MPTRNRVIYQSEALFNTVNTTDVTLAGGTGYNTMQFVGFTGRNNPDVLASAAELTNNVAFTGLNQFSRIQSCNYNFKLTRKDVNQFGNLAAIDRVILDAPTVGLDFTYFLTDMQNERALGFSVTGNALNGGAKIADITSANAVLSCMSGILTDPLINNKNYYIRTVSVGNDANNFGSDTNGTDIGSTIGIGNGFLTNYSLNAAVGDFPTVSVSIEALNMNFNVGNSGLVPAVSPISGNVVTGRFMLPVGLTNPSGVLVSTTPITALRHGDIRFTLNKTAGNFAGGTDLTNISGAAIQNFSLGIPLSRTSLMKLGSKYAYSKEIEFPLTFTLSVDALVQELTTGNLEHLVNNDGVYDAVITLGTASNIGTNEGVGYVLKGLNLDSQDFSSSIGSNKSVSLNFSAQIGSAQQTDKGVFMFETVPLA